MATSHLEPSPMALVAIAVVVILFAALNFLDFKRFD
jgi:hypothetical protein